MWKTGRGSEVYLEVDSSVGANVCNMVTKLNLEVGAGTNINPRGQPQLLKGPPGPLKLWYSCLRIQLKCMRCVLPMSIMICRVVLAQYISSVESSESAACAPSSKFSISPSFMSLVGLSTVRFSFLMLILFELLESSRDWSFDWSSDKWS